MAQPRLARLRVPLGFATAVAGMALAQPTVQSIVIGGVIAAVGEAIRVWAAGHLQKGREVTRSGPYRFVRHPLYAGSIVIGLGFVIVARSPWVGGLVTIYLVTTLLAAIRSEEAALDAKFDGAYSAYREGRATPVDRPFTLARVRENREYRAMAGLVLGLALLYLRSLL